MRIGEALARTLITVGGVSTIAAVVLIVVFLIWVALPLFGGSRFGTAQVLAVAPRAQLPTRVEVDQYGLLGWSLERDGKLRSFAVPTGQTLDLLDPCSGRTPRCAKVDLFGTRLVYGFDDGSVRLGSVAVEATLSNADVARARAAKLGLRGEPGEWTVDGPRVVSFLDGDMARDQGLVAELSAPLALVEGAAILAVDRCDTSQGTRLAALDERFTLHVGSERRTLNLLTEEETVKLAGGSLDLSAYRTRGAPLDLLLTGSGDSALVVWKDGLTVRVDARDLKAIALAEELDLLPEEGVQVNAVGFLNGQTTVLVGDSSGGLSTWFNQRREPSKSSDGKELTLAKQVDCGSPVVALAASRRSRLAIAGLATGGAVALYAPTGVLIARAPPPEDEADPARLLALSSKDDRLFAWGERGRWSWKLDAPHPEASVAALFGPILYEGESEPDHVWQSSSGTDDFEPKLGLVPLIFGTLKATFYSMLFGVPLAILAALYTSEFLHPSWRVPIKSVVEVMAGLPSVVLGFLSAIVIAPFVQSTLSSVLAAFYTIPLCLLAGSYAWQLLPQRTAVRWAGWQRLAAIALALPVGIVLARALGPWTERLLFGGDLTLWLDGQRGPAWSGWFLLLLPICAVVTGTAWSTFVAPWMRRVSTRWDRAKCARFDLGRFLVSCAVTALLAFVVSRGLQALGFDPRGGLVDTYVQRNALVVGFVMGFAIIPIIYTIAEDALSGVPTQLRLASLSAGATPWQTSLRIVLPTAMSGLFSAVMVGLGRAVGETMIVLMATGNTAVMEWNVFNGFRTLSANIAVELPEAVRNDTHYRTLFLAALTLFAMTFVVNTAAELVRQRFRKRAYQL